MGEAATGTETTIVEAPPGEPSVVIRRTIDAPRAVVFDAFADPQQVDQWWGPNGFRNTTHEHEFRPGGTWRFTMHGPDGTDYPNKCVFIDIDPPERVLFDHGWDSAEFTPMFRSEITFRDLGDQTEIALKQVYPSAAERDRNLQRVDAIEGGKQTLARLATFAEAAA